MTRIDDTFARLKAEGKKAFVAYVMAGDPDYATSLEIVKALPRAGVDIIELGMPFTDPMADGETIQLAGQRALEGGQTLDKTLQIARELRKEDDKTPIVMMGYYNPIYSRGVDTFLAQAKEAGIDGLIIVDLPPEEDDELCIPAQAANATPPRNTTFQTNPAHSTSFARTTASPTFVNDRNGTPRNKIAAIGAAAAKSGPKYSTVTSSAIAHNHTAPGKTAMPNHCVACETVRRSASSSDCIFDIPENSTLSLNLPSNVIGSPISDTARS